MFPIFTTLEQFEQGAAPHISGKKEIVRTQHANGWVTYCYMVAFPGTFTDPWSRECRGIAFSPDGRVGMRAPAKFFNLGENADTQPHVLPWDTLEAVSDKMDGSMINACWYDGQVYTKTKKSFVTEQATRAKAYIEARPGYVDLLRHLEFLGMTATFELTSPALRIVVLYDEERLTLLGVRHNHTGDYMPLKDAAALAERFGVHMVPHLHNVAGQAGVKHIMESLEGQKNVEGLVVSFTDGNRVKLKTEQYLMLHRHITFVRVRHIAEAALEEKVDDVKAAMSQAGNLAHVIERINEIELDVNTRIMEIVTEVKEIAARYVNAPKKSAAIALRGHKYFGLIMSALDGKDVHAGAKDYFAKNVLKQTYGLETVDESVAADEE